MRYIDKSSNKTATAFCQRVRNDSVALRRKVEAVRAIAGNKPLRGLLDEILSEHPQTATDRGWGLPPAWREVIQPPPAISSPATPKRAPESEERQIVAVGRWAIATDGIQWIVQRYRGNRWRSLKFVRTTKPVLARCLREAGVSAAESAALLDSIPDKFTAAPVVAAEIGGAP